MASEELKATVQAMREAPSLIGDGSFDVNAVRAALADAPRAPVPDDVTQTAVDAGGAVARHIEAPGARSDRRVLYFHGGGYVILSVDTHAELMSRISRACRAAVLGVDYRLAPEHPYPAAVEDAVAAYGHLLDAGIDPSKIVIAGDSAGGGLTVACMLALKAQGKPLPAGAYLISPWADLTCSGASRTSRADVDPMVSDAMLLPMADLYAADADLADPGLSPLFGDLGGLPPMLIHVGDYEVLLDDSTRLAERAQAAGVDVALQIFDGAYHIFPQNPGLPESAEAIGAFAAFFDRVTG